MLCCQQCVPLFQSGASLAAEICLGVYNCMTEAVVRKGLNPTLHNVSLI